MTLPDTNHTPSPLESTDARARELDNQLAELTDTLLSGQGVNSATIDPELSELLKVSRQLKTLIADDPGPGAAFRARLTQRLTEEWDKERFRRRTNWSQLIRLSMLAAALILVISVAVIFLNGSAGPAEAVGPLRPQFIVVMGIIGAGVIIALIAFGFTRRK